MLPNLIVAAPMVLFPPLSATRTPSVCMLQQQDDFENAAMKDINRAGPSEQRIAQIEKLMNQMRNRGAVGEESLVSAGSRAMGAPPSPPPMSQEDQKRAVEAAAAEAAALIAAEAEAAAVAAAAAGEATLDTADGTESAATESPASTGRTSSIGGRWDSKQAAAALSSKHKPKVSTWGVFERPADISTAFGGGKRIGVDGYQEDEEARARKREEVEANLKAYRQSIGADTELEVCE